MLAEQGKRLPTLYEYAALATSPSLAEDNYVTNNSGCITDLNPDLLFVARASSRHFQFLPGPEFSPRLYRGQNQFFEPCLPSLYRDSGPLDIIYWTAKWLELATILDRHPTCLWLNELEIEGLRFRLNGQVLPQHYGYPTALLDFSRSKDVAMFFATCNYDKAKNRYLPLSSGKAVLYTADLRELTESKNQSDVMPLGWAPLPRPESQKAFAVQLLQGQQLNDKPWVHVETFEITEEISSRYYRMFNSGRALFPLNPFDDHIDALRDNRTIPKSIIEYGIHIGLVPPHSSGIDAACDELRCAGYKIDEAVSEVPDAVISAAKADWEECEGKFRARIRVRGIADHSRQSMRPSLTKTRT